MNTKRFLLCLLLPALLLAGCTSGSNNETADSEPAASSVPTEKPKDPDPNASLVWNDSYADAKNGITGPKTVYALKAYNAGKEMDTPSVPTVNGDMRFLFTGEDATRIAVPSEGYCITLPGAPEADFSLGKFRSQYKTDDYCVTLTVEKQNPYGKVGGHTNKEGYELYLREWLVEQIDDLNFLSKNRILRTRPVQKDVVVGDFTVSTYCMRINQNSKLDYPFYQIAIIRPTETYDYFYLMVMKSKKEQIDALDAAVESFRLIDAIGVPQNGIESYELKENPNWSDETRAYFRQITQRTDVGFGAFHEKNTEEYTNWLWGEDALGTTPDLYMTYLHVGWYDTKADFTTVFENAEKFAGGNGFDGKPVFNLTYQFTVTNNATGGVYTPMFDILRGTLDPYFKQLAGAIKAYGKPIIFRLNNEMNTDWTDYCGMMTLLDPDIFQKTWRHLYDLFDAEGVDNLIWVFNPISTTCPYCNWGEALCYMPGEDYVQMLGLTNYQMNNGLANDPPPASFKEMYSETARKMLPYFDLYPWIIGEFGCGSGGEVMYDWGKKGYVQTEVNRNADYQADWVQGMVDCFAHNDQPANDFCRRIKLALWFSADDYVDSNGDGVYESTNRLRLDESNIKAIKILGAYLQQQKAE